MISDSRKHFLKCMFLTPCVCFLHAKAELINISQIATGTYIALPANANLANANNGATLTYFSTSNARVGSESSGYYAPDPWSAAEGATPQADAVVRQTPLPDYTSGGTRFKYDLHYSESARADPTETPRVAGVTVFKEGWARSVLSYSVRVDHTSATSLYYFIDLAVPKIVHSIQPAYSLSSPDDNGGTYDYQKPKSAKSRATVDIYVNDLPVWSSESGYLYPPGSSDPFAEFDYTWGSKSGPHSSTLFLGLLSQGQSMTVTFVTRAEAKGNGNACGTQDYNNFHPPFVALHCFVLNEAVEMTGHSGNTPAFQIRSTYTSPSFFLPIFGVTDGDN